MKMTKNTGQIRKCKQNKIPAIQKNKMNTQSLAQYNNNNNKNVQIAQACQSSTNKSNQSWSKDQWICLCPTSLATLLDKTKSYMDTHCTSVKHNSYVLHIFIPSYPEELQFPLGKKCQGYSRNVIGGLAGVQLWEAFTFSLAMCLIVAFLSTSCPLSLPN